MLNKIIISEAAYSDIDEIFSYISDKLFSPKAAGKLTDKIFDSIERLRDFSLIGAAPENEVLTAKGYRFLPVDNYLVFYIPKNKEVRVVRVIYGRRDW
ncbi:MAG: type II toxin-antitoxin system RelE/ParE family toxin, partial [Oscillospiraceae bacterium]|nr:type II toxin-antitoxin system RelE/ParE family toxin [Oscillospiraceae bacterium]